MIAVLLVKLISFCENENQNWSQDNQHDMMVRFIKVKIKIGLSMRQCRQIWF